MSAKPGAMSGDTSRESAPGFADVMALLRPHQWVKNGFVFIGLIFVHRAVSVSTAASVIAAAIAFCLAASAAYVGNDVHDAARDRRHPRKRLRPVASGQISSSFAACMSIVLAASALVVASFASIAVTATVAAYLVLQLAYSLRLKEVALLDVFSISAGFMLRIWAGTYAVGIQPSHWLLLCGFMVTLFLGFSKRWAELQVCEEASSRRTLCVYGTAMLDKLLGITGACVIMGYALYTMSAETIAYHGTTNLMFTLPFVVYGVLHYLIALHTHPFAGEDTARDVITNPHLLGASLGWLLSVGAVLA